MGSSYENPICFDFLSVVSATIKHKPTNAAKVATVTIAVMIKVGKRKVTAIDIVTTTSKPSHRFLYLLPKF